MHLVQTVPRHVVQTDGIYSLMMTLRSADVEGISIGRICSKTVCAMLCGKHSFLTLQCLQQ